MKSAFEITGRLYRAVKAKAAIEGRRVTDVVIEGLRLAIDGPTKSEKRVGIPIVKAKKDARILAGLDVKKTLQALKEEGDMRTERKQRYLPSTAASAPTLAWT